MRKKIQTLFLVAFAVLGALSLQYFIYAASPGDIEINLNSSLRASGLHKKGLAVRDNVAFFGDLYGVGTITALDISDPENQTVISTTVDGYYEVEHMVLIGDYLFVTSRNDPKVSGNDSVISAIDVSNPANMQTAGTLTDPLLVCANRMAYSANTLFVDGCSADDQIVSVDISDPTNMSVLDTFDYSGYGSFVIQGNLVHNSEGLFLKQIGSYLYVLIDTSDPSNLVLSEAVTEASAGVSVDSDIAISGNYVYFQSGTDLITLDVASPASPVVVDTDSLGMCVLDGRPVLTPYSSLILMCDQEVFSVEDRAVYTVDISTPSAPTLSSAGRALYSYAHHEGQLVFDNNNMYRYDFYSDYYNMTMVSVYDVSDVSQPPQFIDTDLNDFFPGWVSNAVSPSPSSNTVFIVSETFPVIRAIDVSDPSDIRVINDDFLRFNGEIVDNYSLIFDTPVFSPNGQYMLLNEESYYDNGFSGHLTMVDISDPENITVADRITLPPAAINMQDGVVVGSNWYILADDGVDSNVVYSYQIDEITGTITYLDEQALTIGRGPAGISNFNDQRYIDVVGDTAYVLNRVGGSIEYLDVSNPSSLGAPASVSYPAGVTLGLRVGNPFATNGHLYFASGTELYAIEASDPANLSLSDSFSETIPFQFEGSDAEEMQLDTANSNTLVFVKNSDDDYIRFDITDPATLTLIDQAPTNTGLFSPTLDGFDNLWHTLFIGNNAYGSSAVSDGQFYSFDVTDLSNPRPLDVLANGSALYSAASISFYGDYAYIGSNLEDYENDVSLAVYDIADTANPRFVGAPVHEYQAYWDSEIQGDYMYASFDGTDLRILDLDNPEFPVTIHSNKLDAGGNNTESYDIDIAGDYIYVADEVRGLVVHDITNPTQAPEVGQLADGDFSMLRSLEVDGNYVYGISRVEDVLVVLDVSNPAAPTRLLTISESFYDQLDDVRLVGDRLYMVGHGDNTGSHFTIYDISTPANPTLVGSYVGPAGRGYEDVEVYDAFALIAAADSSAIDVIDLEDEYNPVLLKSLSNDSLLDVNELEIRNDELFALSGNYYSGSNLASSSLNTYSLVLGASSGGGLPPSDGDPPSAPTDSDPVSPPTEDVLAPTGQSNRYLLLGAAILVISGVYVLMKTRTKKVVWKAKQNKLAWRF